MPSATRRENIYQSLFEREREREREAIIESIDYTMVGEKKRKRTEDGNGRMKKAEAAPPDEEVEEFFAILRRMHVAIQYFEKVNGNGKVDGRKLTGRTAIEAEALAMTDGVKAGEESISGARKNGVLDLNAVPEDESHGV
ncbi:protein NIM1-INTERACTING 2-like [Actinidia eriantha]|uniref:protein NIM1-INTERACTING 2-like n=1 Tax=Actinidia eriantha TaxID=165200 RepID=UPI0025831D1E|nr:protein NIM1-INTERACTING 2-like [Actinidia eriantha]